MNNPAYILKTNFSSIREVNAKEVVKKHLDNFKRYELSMRFCVSVLTEMHKRRMSREELSQLLGCPLEETNLILKGREHCTPERIEQLQKIFKLNFPLVA